MQVFIEKILKEENFSKEDLKTRSFRLYEEKRFDYDINVVAEFIDRASKLETPPKYTISFNVKNEQQSRNEAMAEAYSKAKEKVEAIATVSGKTLKECTKVDFRPFEERVYSRSVLGSGVFELED